MSNCVFCKIVSGNCPDTKLVFENEDLIVFKDIKPATDFHFLAVPRKHSENVRNLISEDEELIKEMEAALRQVLQNNGVDFHDARFGFHVPPFTSVSHLHMHGMAPVSKMGFLSRMIFRPDSMWFSTTEKILKGLADNKKESAPDQSDAGK